MQREKNYSVKLLLWTKVYVQLLQYQQCIHEHTHIHNSEYFNKVLMIMHDFRNILFSFITEKYNK